MNRLNEKQNEKGSVLVEVIAVIALLGVMGPLLFRQVMTRNEEVENINIASEMRTLKEAFSAYILADKARLLKNWSGGDEGTCLAVWEDDIYDFLPLGNDSYEGYKFWLCKVSDNFLQGYIVPTDISMPEHVGLKRAARIANLIGADAAICQGGNINGVAGGWGFEGDEYGWCSAGGNTVYLATTGMDTYMPEVTYEDYSTGIVSLPDKLALQDLHAWNYFSVGHSQNCFELNHNKMGDYDPDKGFIANDDKIYDAGDSVTAAAQGEGKCDPLFWVSSVQGGDREQGNVYVKNDLMVGRVTDGSTTNPKHKQAIGLFRDPDMKPENDDSYVADRSAKNKIIVYDNTGKERVTINGKGEILAVERSTAGTVTGSVFMNGTQINVRDSSGKTKVGIDKTKITINDSAGKERININNGGDISVADTAGTKRVKITDEGSISVSNSSGTDKVVINNSSNQGQVIAYGTDTETMKMTNHGLESSKTTSSNEKYKIDPAYTSVMKDIKLESRGGAPLSEILPNYISRGVYTVNGSTNTVPIPTCPTGYTKAIIVTPTMWKDKPKVVKEDNIEGGNLKTEERNINVTSTSAGGYANSFSFTLEPLNITAEKDLEVQNSGLKISISGTEQDHASSSSSGNWTIKFLKADASNNSSNSDDLRTDVKGLAQTFCVYDNNYTTANWSSSKKPSNLTR